MVSKKFTEKKNGILSTLMVYRGKIPFFVFWQASSHNFHQKGTKFGHMYFWNVYRYFFVLFEILICAPIFAKNRRF